MKKNFLHRVCRITAIAFVVSLLIYGFAFAEKKGAKVGKVYEVEGIININSAEVKDLIILPGIGEKKAENIVVYRKEVEKFSSIDDIKKVNGIGEKIFDKIKDNIALEGKTTLKRR